MKTILLLMLFPLLAFAGQNSIGFEGGVDGATATGAALTNSTTGDGVGNWDLSIGNDVRFSTTAAKIGTLGLIADINTSAHYIKYYPTNTALSASAATWIKTDVAATAVVNLDVFTLAGNGATDFCNLIIYGDGESLQFRIETAHTTGNEPAFAFSSNTWYWAALYFNVSGDHKIEIRNEAGTLLHTFTGATPSTVPADCIWFAVTYATTSSGHIFYDGTKTEFPRVNYPLLPDGLPAATSTANITAFNVGTATWK